MSREADERFARVFALHGPALRRLASAYARTEADAEDLFQEICLAVWRALPGFRGEASERTFVFRIGHNRGLTHRARRSVGPPLVELDDAGEIADRVTDLEEAAIQTQSADRLLQAVRELPASLQQVALLCLEGLRNQEIAEVTGLTETNVGVRLHRARRALRAKLEGEE